MELLDIYRSLLRFSGLEADKDGYISAVINDRREPTHVNGLRLVLPTNEQLRHFKPNEKIIFHPLAENILKEEASDVTKKFRDVINIRLNYTIGIVMQSLLNLIASPEQHKHLTPEQTELLLAIKDCDDKTVTNFITHMVSLMKTKQDRAFVNIFLKKGGWKAKDKFSRLAVVSFPFYETIGELKVRKKDQEAYKQIFEYLFMGISNKDEYNYGSNSRVAPYLDALMNAAVGIGSRLNDTLQLFSNFIEDADKLMFDPEWYEYFQDLDELLPEIRKVPAHVSQDNIVEPVQESQPLPAPIQQQQYPYVQQQQMPGPIQIGIDVQGRPIYAPGQQPMPVQQQMPVQQMQYPQVPVVVPQYVQPAGGYVQQMVPQNFMPQQQMPVQQVQYQQPPQPVVTERGLDFRSMVQANPNIAAVPNPLMPQLINQYNQALLAQQPQQQPSWAGVGYRY